MSSDVVLMEPDEYKKGPGIIDHHLKRVELTHAFDVLMSYGIKPGKGMAALQYYSMRSGHVIGGNLRNSINVSKKDAIHLRAWLNQYGFLNHARGRTQLTDVGEQFLDNVLSITPEYAAMHDSTEEPVPADYSVTKAFWNNNDIVSEKYNVISSKPEGAVKLEMRNHTNRVAVTDGEIGLDIGILNGGRVDLTPDYLVALLKKYVPEIRETDMKTFIRANSQHYKAQTLIVHFSALLGKKKFYDSKANKFTDKFADLLDSSETLIFGGPYIGPKNDVRTIQIDGMEIERPSPEDVYALIKKLMNDPHNVPDVNRPSDEKSGKTCNGGHYVLKPFPLDYKTFEDIKRLTIVNTDTSGTTLLLKADGPTENGRKFLDGTETYGLNKTDEMLVRDILTAKKNNGHHF